MPFKLRGLAVALGMTALAGPVSAAVVSGDVTMMTDGSAATFVEITDTDGYTVGFNNEDKNDLFAFNEDQNIILDRDLNVGGVLLTEGTVVASHYVFFDPETEKGQKGSVTFDSAVLAIIRDRDDLMATDFLANNDVTYLSEELRGLEPKDKAWIDPNDANTVMVHWRANNPGDHLRVFTARSPSGPENRPPDEPADVPLPAGAMLLLGGLGILAAKRRRKQRV